MLQALFMGGQHRRCLHLLQNSSTAATAAVAVGNDARDGSQHLPLTEVDIRFRYLAGRCMAAAGDWDAVLAMLDSPGGTPALEDLSPVVPRRPFRSPSQCAPQSFAQHAQLNLCMKHFAQEAASTRMPAGSTAIRDLWVGGHRTWRKMDISSGRQFHAMLPYAACGGKPFRR